MRTIRIGLALLGIAGACHGQQPGMAPPLPVGASTDADVRVKNPDPSAVVIPLYAGAKVTDVLRALEDKGFMIKWSPAQVTPSMKLHEKPKATRIDKLLNEILLPWGMRADRNQMDGGYRVRPLKNAKK
jgi:hypothetical protein